VGTRSFYRLRLADEGFRIAWDAALDEGCRQVEAMLLAAALGEPLAEGVDRKQVLEMLARREARGTGAPASPRGRQVAIEMVERSLLRKLDALDRRRRGKGAPASPRGRQVAIEMVERSLLRKLDALDRRRRGKGG
jgi:hypothetical protein